MSDLTTIRNIGPALETSLIAAGITTAAQLHDIGADAAYSRLLTSGTKPHFISYYVLHMSLQGRPWNDCKGAEKLALRTRFDEIKAVAFDQDRSTLEAILDRIGVIDISK